MKGSVKRKKKNLTTVHYIDTLISNNTHQICIPICSSCSLFFVCVGIVNGCEGGQFDCNLEGERVFV